VLRGVFILFVGSFLVRWRTDQQTQFYSGVYVFTIYLITECHFLPWVTHYLFTFTSCFHAHL